MVFQISTSSTWKMLLQIYSVILPALAAPAIAAGIILSETGNPDTRPLGVILLVVGIVGIGCLIWLTSYTRVKTDMNFRNQLMEEYHAKSSRSFSAIEEGLYHSNGMSTVFTRDGKETEVFVKAVNGNKNRIAMAFNVIDDKTLYSKPSK